MKNYQMLKYSIIIVIAIIVFLNILSGWFFIRLDTTQDKRYTLSQATKNILKDLEEPVTIKAYFTRKLPPQLYQGRQEFSDLLMEYASRSGGMVLYEFLDPSEDEELASEAQSNGIPPLQVQVRNKDKFEAMVCYLGAVIQMGDSEPEVIPQITSGMEVEYYLTAAIKKVSIKDKPRIAFLQGHGEPGLSAVLQAKNQLDVLYQTDFIYLSDTTDALAPYKTLVIIAPTDSFPESHLNQLDNFLAKGNNMLIALNRVDADLQNGYGMEVNTGLETWLSGKGITIENSFLVDANCGRVGVVQNMGGFTIQQQIPFPYLPIIKNFNKKHPITKGIQEAIFSFASPIIVPEDSALHFEPLALTSNKSGKEVSPVYFNVGKNWGDNEFPLNSLVVAATVEGNFSGKENPVSKMAIFGDGDFAVNRDYQNQQSINPDNISLLTNSIDWLTDVTGLIDLRTKEITSRPIKDLEDSTKAFLKWLNFLLPIFLILGIGLYRWQKQSILRIKRMQENYVK